MDRITSCLHGTKMTPIKTLVPDASDALIRIDNTQNKIGWDQVLKGRLCIGWGELYNHDIAMDKLKLTTTDAEQWGKKCLTIIWKFVIDMWRQRNETEHNLDGETSKIAKRKEIEQILWIINAVKEYKEIHPYMNATEISLEKYPINNLKMMNQQMQTLYASCKSKYISRTGKNKVTKEEKKAEESSKKNESTKNKRYDTNIKHESKKKTHKGKNNRKDQDQPLKKYKKLSLTAQAILHISTHEGEPPLGEELKY
jgi:hypothetical protein